MTDQIQTEIGNLQNLEILALGTNNLSGLIPPAIFNISTIRYLTLSINNLIGTIPDSITNASKLIGLDLGANSFSGHIPNTFGNLRHLNVLSLWCVIDGNFHEKEAHRSNVHRRNEFKEMGEGVITSQIE
ncbi:hypothetical protein CUMW_134710 [Citrus unshiu]|nr:hypothetical protein CUMW_134710 [Citrus unshiu]